LNTDQHVKLLYFTLLFLAQPFWLPFSINIMSGTVALCHLSVLSWFVCWIVCLNAGTPCTVKVIDPNAIEVANYNERWNEYDHFVAQIGELQTVVFDCRFAGPGNCFYC